MTAFAIREGVSAEIVGDSVGAGAELHDLGAPCVCGEDVEDVARFVYAGAFYVVDGGKHLEKG